MKSFGKTFRGYVIPLMSCVLLHSAHAQQSPEVFKIGIVGFLSGPVAESFGIPAQKSAQMLIDAFNAGKAPAPYGKIGFGGMRIEAIYLDESGPSTKQVQEFRNLVQRENVDAVVGYISSGNCLAVAPVAEELKRLVIVSDCSTTRLFEEHQYNYVFRTTAHAIMDNVGLVRYMVAKNIRPKTLNLINQDYALGQDSRAVFTSALKKLIGDVTFKADLLPKFGAGQYGSEISALAREKADAVYTSLWGGDLNAFVLQAAPRRFFEQNPMLFSVATPVMPQLGEKFPQNAVVAARGGYSLIAEKTPLNKWFVDTYRALNNGAYPFQPQYSMSQSLLALKVGIEGAMQKNGGKKPTSEQIAASLKGISYEGPAGKVQMSLGNGHQAIHPIPVGRSSYDAATKTPVIVDVIDFPAECVNPPANMKSLDWIEAGLPSTHCPK